MRASDNEESEAINDFERRCAYAPASVYIHRDKQWRYIPIHPFADEPGVLRRLGIGPDDCRGVDAYWRTHDAVYFLQVWTQRVDTTDRKPGLYAQRPDGSPALCYLTAIVPDATVTRTHFESIMEQLHRQIEVQPTFFNLSLGAALVPISTLD